MLCTVTYLVRNRLNAIKYLIKTNAETGNWLSKQQIHSHDDGGLLYLSGTVVAVIFVAATAFNITNAFIVCIFTRLCKRTPFMHYVWYGTHTYVSARVCVCLYCT